MIWVTFLSNPCNGLTLSLKQEGVVFMLLGFEVNDEADSSLPQELGASSVSLLDRVLTLQEEIGSSLLEEIEAAADARTQLVLLSKQVVVWVVLRGFALRVEFDLMSMQEVRAPLAVPSCMVLTS